MSIIYIDREQARSLSLHFAVIEFLDSVFTSLSTLKSPFMQCYIFNNIFLNIIRFSNIAFSPY
jgi:hypothetical protein